MKTTGLGLVIDGQTIGRGRNDRLMRVQCSGRLALDADMASSRSRQPHACLRRARARTIESRWMSELLPVSVEHQDSSRIPQVPKP